GFRIDRRSCDHEPRAVAALEGAAALVSGPMTSCLAELNPRYAAQFAANLATRLPRLQCTGTDEGRSAVIDNCCDGISRRIDGELRSEAQCRGYWSRSRMMAGHRSFFARTYPFDIQLSAT